MAAKEEPPPPPVVRLTTDTGSMDVYGDLGHLVRALADRDDRILMLATQQLQQVTDMLTERDDAIAVAVAAAVNSALADMARQIREALAESEKADGVLDALLLGPSRVTEPLSAQKVRGERAALRSASTTQVVNDQSILPSTIKVVCRDARDHFPGELADLAVFSPPYPDAGVVYDGHVERDTRGNITGVRHELV